MNSKCCSEGSICVWGEANCNPPWYEMSHLLLLTNKADFFTDFPIVSGGNSMQAVNVQHSPQPAAPLWAKRGSRRAKRHLGAALPMPTAQGVVEGHAARWWCPRSDKAVGCCTEMDGKDYTGSRLVYPLKEPIFSKIWDLEECKSASGASKKAPALDLKRLRRAEWWRPWAPQDKTERWISR